MANTSQAAAPGSPYFALHTLGWRAFQDLCAAVLRHVWGQSVQAFADSNDAGRDGAFYGNWSNALCTDVDGIPQGAFVLQCKHTKSPEATLSESMLADEFDKIRRLVLRGVCQTYILLTNARITGASEEKIRKRLADLGVEHPLLLGGQWICDTIAAHRNLRMYVPRVYGLGDLSQILDERAYQQASVVLASAKEQVSAFVVTTAYRKAAKALEDHGFVLLLGEPGVGKSAIALMLAMSAADRWGCSVIKARDSHELVDRWNPNEESQLFWIDDAFGAVRHEERLSSDWSRDMAHVMGAIKTGARVVLTSRSYIYEEARPVLKGYAYPIFNEQHVIVDVATIGRDERQQILYNNLKVGDQSPATRALLKPHLEAAADAEPFLPEAARRLGRQAFTRNVRLDRDGIVEFVARPHEFLQDIYDQLPAAAQAALALVYSADSEGLAGALQLGQAQHGILTMAGATVGETGKTLITLDGAFLRREQHRTGEGRWQFKHPTLREGFAHWLAGKHHLVPAVLNGMNDSALLDSTDAMTKDAAPVRGTVLRLPAAQHATVARRLLKLFEKWPDGSCWTGDALSYLAYRSSDAMLRTYVAVDPQFPERILEFEAFASFVQEPTLLRRLHEIGLLSEANRRAACNRMARLAVCYLDPAWIDDQPWKVLLTPTERARLLAHVRAKLVPVLDAVVDERWAERAFWVSSEEHPEAVPEDLVAHALELYRRAFDDAGDHEAAAAFARAAGRHQHRRSSDDATRSEHTMAVAGGTTEAAAYPVGPARSTFADIDASE